MHWMNRRRVILAGLVSVVLLVVCGPAASGVLSEKDLALFGKPKAAFDVGKMGDMSGFDPSKWANPAGDTIKFAVAWPHSGPGALNGDLAWACLTFVAYDINQRGGIVVDGKKKKIALFKADTMSKPDQAKTIAEKMILQEKVDAILGTSGSNIQKILNSVAARHKVLSVNFGALADELMDAENFSPYAFMTSDTTEAIGRGMAYYYGQIRKKEKKFYIINQDYSFGHGMSEGFKKGLKEYFPEAQVVGEDFHKLFATDYAPYLTKVKASGAEVIWTGAWLPDSGNLLKQARMAGINIPIANLYIDEPNSLTDVGVEGTKNLFNIKHFDVAGPAFRDPGIIKYYKAWNDAYQKWTTAPYNTPLFKHPFGTLGHWSQNFYWFLSVMERAGTTNADKIIALWEGDVYQFISGRIVKMRPCDHRSIQGFRVAEFVPPDQQKASFNIPPYNWYDNTCNVGPSWDIPASAVLPPMDAKLDRCAASDGWGNPAKN